MEITGIIKIIKETEEVSPTFSKKQIVVTDDGQYPQDLPIDFVQTHISKLDGFSEGQKVKVSINLRGSEYQGKHYLSAQGWAISKVDTF